MITLLLILGIILIVGLPIYGQFFFYEKIKNENYERIFFIISLIPGIIMLGIASYFYSNIPLTKSVECGVFKEYKTFQSRHGEYEMLAIIMDKSGYIRYFNFDKSLPRIASHQHVCLELYDRFKNKGLSQSKILRIIAN